MVVKKLKAAKIREHSYSFDHTHTALNRKKPRTRLIPVGGALLLMDRWMKVEEDGEWGRKGRSGINS